MSKEGIKEKRKRKKNDQGSLTQRPRARAIIDHIDAR